MAKDYPSRFCINSSHSLGADNAVQSHKPWEASFGVGRGRGSCGKSSTGLHGPYLSIRTSSWAPTDRQTEKLVTKGGPPQIAPLPQLTDAPGENGSKARQGCAQPWPPLLFTLEAHSAAAQCVRIQQVRPQCTAHFDQ